MDKLIGSLCRHTESYDLGLGVIIYVYKPPFEGITHPTQRMKKAYKVHWLSHPKLDVPPILAEHLMTIDGVRLA